ncbi:hypothetical protein OG562_21870 [Streptomyces sp. NBC_01275]|uniref:hypothetical protein n=1 Tax=Streptomyces sp. NBC_01275 TaxID=2903807 RepID=UPI0022520322|nr:hypothetical protein [Streptomyces sp. NBC_01275]MCX4763563.1 hypothetical protein [Streptomyces sp. NBC_01275]
MTYDSSAQADPTTDSSEESLDRALAARAAAGNVRAGATEARPTAGADVDLKAGGSKPAVRKQAPSM